MSRAADALPSSPGQRETLEVLARSTTAAYREGRRAQALLMAADGLPDVPIAAAVAVTPVTVRGWRARFAEEGLARFAEVRESRGRKPSIPAETVNEIVRVTLHEAPPGATHWSTRTMAARGGGQPGHRAPGLAGPGAAAASGGDVQVVHRSAVRGEARRRCRAVPEPAGEGRGAVPGREEPGAGVGPHPAVAAHEEGPGRHHDPRLQAQRDDHAVRRAERADGGGHRPVPAPAPSRRVPRVPAPHPAGGPPRPAGARDPGQLRDAQPPRRRGLVGQAPPLSPALHPDQLVLAQSRGALVPGPH